MQDIYGTVSEDGSHLSYNDGIVMYAKVLNKQNQKVSIVYTADVRATAGISWETDEIPTGWNYKNDSVIYSTSSFATPDEIKITNISFNRDDPITIGHDEYTVEEMQQILHPMSIKALLNPTVFAQALEPYFNRKAEEIESSGRDDY